MKDKDEKIKLEIQLLEKYYDLSKFNYNVWISIYFTGVILIFAIIPIMVEIFPDNKLGIFIGGLIAFIIFSNIFAPKLYHEGRMSNVKYESIKERYEELGVDTNKIGPEINNKYNNI